MRKLLVGLAIGIVTSLSFALPALAGPAFTETNTVKNVTETFTDVICEGGTEYDITTISNLIEHITIKDATFHVTFTQAGKFTAVDPGTGEIITGSFAVWGGFNGTFIDPEDPDSDLVPGTPAQGTFTFSARGRGDMGTRIQTNSVEHFNVTPGESVKEFFHGHCNVS
jgi:hypothetical protein